MINYFLDNFKNLSNLDRVALVDKNNYQISWKKYYNYCSQFSNSLKNINISKEQSIGIIGFNSPEWFYSAIGAIMYSKYVGIYNTNGPKEVDYIFNMCNVAVFVVENMELLEKLKITYPLKLIILYNDHFNKRYYNDIPIVNFYDFIENSSNIPVQNNIQPESTICYYMTSGTTGPSKVVEITYKNMSYTCGLFFTLSNSPERILSYLPLSHTAGSRTDMFYHFYHGGIVYFGNGSELKGNLINSLQKVRPTIFLSVPRIWEKLSDEINKRKMNSIIPECITNFFKKKTLEYNNYIGKINNISFFIIICYLISRLIICNSIKKNIGLNNCRTFYNTASNISKKTLDYFAEIDIPIYEMYGMTETCGVISVNYKNNYKKYSVGKPFYGEVKLGWDNEIIYRGPNIFKKYKYNYIDTEKTLKDGWLYTGDTGEFDDDGYLYITGRKKDLIKTSGGENISPLKIETEIKEYALNINYIIIIGEGRKFLIALIFMKNYNEEYIKKAIDKYNQNAISKAQKIKKYIVINNDLTVDNGLLTQTMKMKRNMIEKRYQKIIDEIYSK